MKRVQFEGISCLYQVAFRTPAFTLRVQWAFPGVVQDWVRRSNGEWRHVGHYTEPTSQEIRLLEHIYALETEA